jgi:hypothetical protein
MLKKIRFSAGFKKLHCRMGLAGSEKLGPWAGQARIFKPGDIN